MKYKKLVIISHTEHFKNKNQEIVGWGATINEVNYLADYWDEVIHVGCFYKSIAPKSALQYTKNNIRFVPIPPYGGKSIFDKIKILFRMPIIIYQVIKSIKNASEVQLRLPTSMGLFLLPLFSFLLPRKYIFWVKYAGNWNQENPPMSYKFQRWWLKNNFAKCRVTINGFWDNQPSHCISFENPCLTNEQLNTGKNIALNKNFEVPFNFVFIGRLEDPKGVGRIIETLKEIPIEKINKIHFVGDGEKLDEYKYRSSFLGDKVLFHGFQSTKNIHKILSESDFFLLPSTASEGFPKVIAEAACYGVIPIVSDVGSIGHYVNDSNGFLWKINSTNSFTNVMSLALNDDLVSLENRSKKLFILAEKFTFTNYFSKLKSEILK